VLTSDRQEPAARAVDFDVDSHPPYSGHCDSDVDVRMTQIETRSARALNFGLARLVYKQRDTRSGQA
jgi:hypothetical protein